MELVFLGLQLDTAGVLGLIIITLGLFLSVNIHASKVAGEPLLKFSVEVEEMNSELLQRLERCQTLSRDLLPIF